MISRIEGRTPRTEAPVIAFTYLTGQFDNLGDALLRRAMIGAVHGNRTWHVYVGTAPDDYVTALQLPAEAIIYRSRVRWYSAALRSLVATRRTQFLANPGEISSSRIELVLGAMSASLLLTARVTRNSGVRAGIGARDRVRPLSLGHELATRLSTVMIWRDEKSRDLFGRGEVGPDWAFALAPWEKRSESRGTVALSYRGDKPLPSRATLDAIAAWCVERDLRPVVVSQVKRDADAGEQLARILDAPHVGSEGDLREIEAAVRDVFSRSAIVLSNRIHVLIVASVDGAAVGSVLAHRDVKVGRTLKAGQVPIDVLVEPQSPTSVRAYLDGLIAEGSPAMRGASDAHRQLAEIATRITKDAEHNS